MGRERADYHGREAATGGVGPGPEARSSRPGAKPPGPPPVATSPRRDAATAAPPPPRSWATGLALAAAFAIALALRLVPLATAPGGDLTADSAFHMRMIEEVLGRGRVPALDPMCEAPDGRAIGAMLPTGLYHAAAWLHRALAPLDGRDARFHSLLFTALAGALIVVPAYFAARCVFAGRPAAVVAALLAAVIPAHLHRTYAYWLRYDALGTLLALAHVALLLHAVASPAPRGARVRAVLAALALAAAVACWRVALVLPFLEVGFVLLWAAWRGGARQVREPMTIVVGLSTLLFPLVPYLRAQAFPLSGAWLAAVAATAALWLPWLAPSPRRWPARAAFLALACGAGWTASRLFPRPNPYAEALGLVPAKLAAAFGARPELPPIVSLEMGIQELTSLSPLGLIGPGALSWLAPWFVASPLLFAWGGRVSARARLGTLAPAPALFAALCAAMTLVTLLFERNKVLLAPLVAVACGGLAARLAAAALAPASAPGGGSSRAARDPRRSEGRARPRSRPAASAALTVLFAMCAAVTAFHAVMLAASRRPALGAGLAEALAFLRERTPEGAVVMSPWEHGYEVQTHAGRATVMDGLIESPENQRRIVAFAGAAMMQAPDSLAALCRRHGAEWLLVPPSTHLHAVAVVARAPFTAKLLPRIPLTPAEADRVLVQMMVLGREYPGFVKAFERDGYRVYHLRAAQAP